MRAAFVKPSAFLPLLLPVALLATPAPTAGTPAERLWYSQPAAKWTDALPIGNGRLGAMVFGGIVDERIQFNEDTLWRGQPHDYDRADAHAYLGEIRRLLAEGKDAEAAQLARAQFLGDPVRQKAYQPFGDLRLHFAGQEDASDYRRELDLDSATARVTCRAKGVNYLREAFASYPDQAIVIRITADHGGQIDLTLQMDSPHRTSRTQAIASDTLALTGQVEAGGLRFEARARVLAVGGEVVADGRGLTVKRADSVMFLVTAATSFRTFADISDDPGARCSAIMARLAGRDYDSLRAAHLTDYRRLFRRVALDLGQTDRAGAPTDQRLQQVKAAGLDGDPALAALFFQYGRYLLIASSRPGGQPANLQGLWNELLDPPWESKWTTNINLEMNYWPAEVTNLGECHQPLFDLIDDLAVTGHRTAKAYYGCDGWVLHHNTDLWRGTAPVNNVDGIWPTGGAWLCHHLWEHYLFTGDREYLARRAYPVMKQAAQFFVEYLVPDPKTGWLVSIPSYSPEQDATKGRALVAGPTMDNQLIRALLGSTIEAAGILGIDRDFAARLVEVRRRLPPNQIGKLGQLQEWLDDVDRPNNNHRHLSPLWALYPGADITPAEPAVFAAARQLLTWRGDGSTGWSYAWRIPLWARVGDGNFAYRQLSQLLTRKALPNLFDLCGPFQIDGNFGACAGIAEMLLQSQRTIANDRIPEVRLLELLPALPKAWPAGSATGLCARGGFEVDLTWDRGALTRVTLRSKLGAPCRVAYGARMIDLRTSAGATYVLDGELHPAP